MLTTDSLSSPKLRRAWLRLWNEAGEHPFHHPAWQVTALRLWHRRQPLLLALWEGDALEAVAALVRCPVDGRFQIAGSGVSGYNDFLSLPRSRVAFARALVAYVEAQQMVLDLQRMPEPFVPASGEVLVLEQGAVLRLRLDDWDMEKKLHSRLLFLRRELNRQGRLRLFTAAPNKARDLFAILLHLRRRSLKATRVTRMPAERKREMFAAAAFHALHRRGLARLLALSLDARVVACAAVLTCGRSAFHWLDACDPQASAGRELPGLLHYHALETFQREGFWTYDLLRFASPIACRFGAKAKPTFRTLLFPDRWHKALAAPLFALGHRLAYPAKSAQKRAKTRA